MSKTLDSAGRKEECGNLYLIPLPRGNSGVAEAELLVL